MHHRAGFVAIRAVAIVGAICSRIRVTAKGACIVCVTVTHQRFARTAIVRLTAVLALLYYSENDNNQFLDHDHSGSNRELADEPLSDWHEEISDDEFDPVDLRNADSKEREEAEADSSGADPTVLQGFLKLCPDFRPTTFLVACHVDNDSISPVVHTESWLPQFSPLRMIHVCFLCLDPDSNFRPPLGVVLPVLFV